MSSKSLHYWQIIKKKIHRRFIFKKEAVKDLHWALGTYREWHIHIIHTYREWHVHIIRGADRGCEQGMTEDYKVYKECIQGVTGDQLY